MISTLTVLLIGVFFSLLSWSAFLGELPVLNLLIVPFGIILFLITNNPATTLFNVLFLIEAIIAAIGGVLGSVFAILEKKKPTKKVLSTFVPLFVLLMAFGSQWGISSVVANNDTEAKREIWQVPDIYEKESSQPGKIEEINYPTKAYATDKRSLTKRAYVYVPYGYDSTKNYDILYLLHGTGDDEAYWLITNPKNKALLDNLTERKIISPMLVVTPTFYVEDDCKESIERLDLLTYSFKEELRNDLLPYVESHYSTYAETADDKGFKSSRQHRSFAGLSRGAVTTLRSAFCGSLDYFSRFGSFSGSRTGATYFQDNIQSEAFKDLPIDYWYVSSGNFDFALSSQVEDYHNILKIEPRLKAGVNTNFDVFPMRYHSQGNWHLALYNFLIRVYKSK